MGIDSKKHNQRNGTDGKDCSQQPQRTYTYKTREWIQNSDFQNSDITKQRLLKKSDNYKTVTKQRLLQNSDCYKTVKNNII